MRKNLLNQVNQADKDEKTRIPPSDTIPNPKPKWLSQRYAPKNDSNFKEMADYPNYGKAGNPIEWLR